MPPTDARLTKMREIAKLRTRKYTFVLEDLNDPHNISAVLRSCECFGLQELHVIEELRPFRVSRPIVKGADQWIDIIRWTSRQACLDHLRERGFTIALASSRAEKSFHTCDLDRPLAIYMGTEFAGNSQHAYQNADMVFKLPQHGFTESLNVSVCAGMMIAHLDRHMDLAGREKFTLSDSEVDEVVARWSQAHDERD
jgi:tRNA (guanosine-2'-O-)-methyltransferase